MATNSWHQRTSRDIEHEKTQDLGMARSGGRPKTGGPAPIHPTMRDRVSSSVGAPPTGNPPDASSPDPVDSEKQHGDKTLPIPRIAWGMKNDPERGHVDSNLADRVMGEAHRDATDHTRLGKMTLPEQVNEES